MDLNHARLPIPPLGPTALASQNEFQPARVRSPRLRRGIEQQGQPPFSFIHPHRSVIPRQRRGLPLVSRYAVVDLHRPLVDPAGHRLGFLKTLLA